jgi:hypothetical protein
MGAFLGLFGDAALNDRWLAGLAVGWWLDLMAIDRFRQHPLLLAECMYPPAFRLSQWSQSGILKGIPRHEDAHRFSAILAFLLFQVLKHNSDALPQAWSAIESCCSIKFAQNETAYQDMLQRLIPRSFRVVFDQALEPPSRKLDWLGVLTCALPEEDRKHFEAELVNLGRELGSRT